MISELRQYRVVCDTTGCQKGSGAHVSPELALDFALSYGWQVQGTQPVLHRCPKCVKAGLLPRGWVVGVEVKHGVAGS